MAKDRIKELEEEIAFLKRDPSAKFYAALVEAVDDITTKLNRKTLDFETDPFAKSVVVLSEKSEKIFNGLSKGLEALQKSEVVDTKNAAKVAKSQQVGI